MKKKRTKEEHQLIRMVRILQRSQIAKTEEDSQRNRNK